MSESAAGQEKPADAARSLNTEPLLPDVWLGPGNGLSLARTGAGRDPGTGWGFVDIRITGTATGTCHLYFGGRDEMLPALAGEAWTSSVAVGLISGTGASLRIGMYFFDADKNFIRSGGQAAESFCPQPLHVAPLQAQRVAWRRVSGDQATRYVRQQIWLDGVGVGEDCDFTLRIADPRLECSIAAPARIAAPEGPLAYQDVHGEEFDRVVQQHVQPVVLPFKCAEGQEIRILRVADAGRVEYLPYIVSGARLYLQVQRGFFPFPEFAGQTVAQLFAAHPTADTIVATMCLDPLDSLAVAERTVNRQTFFTELPEDFASFRMRRISAKFRLDLGRHERRLHETVAGLHFAVLRGESFTEAQFSRLVDVVESRLRERFAADGRAWQEMFPAEWRRLNYPVFRDKGFAAGFWAGETPIAVAILGHCGIDYYFTLSGYNSLYSKYSISSVLLLRIIELIINEGGRRLHLGGGDFGYKSRFGAAERPLFDLRITRQV